MENKMSKFKSLLVIIIFFFLGCSHNVTKEETQKVAKPIIDSILEYKKARQYYPSSLMEIKNFPYKIKPLATVGEYYFVEKDDLTLYAGGFETGLNSETGFIYYIQISFDESRGSGAITSVFIGFKKDSSYEISYSSMPPAFKQ
jgi:hypothetical protein